MKAHERDIRRALELSSFGAGLSFGVALAPFAWGRVAAMVIVTASLLTSLAFYRRWSNYWRRLDAERLSRLTGEPYRGPGR